jgi:hypothetical protein
MAHDHVQNVLQQQMRAAGMFADTREVRLEQEQHGKIPDVHAVLDGHHVFVDVSGTTSSSTPSVRDGKFSSKLSTVTATHEREQEKVREYAPMVAIQKAEFFPFVFERDTLALGKQSLVLLQRILSCASRSGGVAMSADSLLAALMSAICRSNLAMIVSVVDRDSKQHGWLLCSDVLTTRCYVRRRARRS